jgi:hypothetical protein
MDCRTFKELVPALALDALDEAERAACAAHLAGPGPHDGCAEAESDARALAARLARALPERPVAPRVWRAIEVRAQAEQAARIADAKDDDDNEPPPRRREPAGWGVAVILLGLYLARNPERVAGAPTSPTLGCGPRAQIQAYAAARVIEAVQISARTPGRQVRTFR